VIKVLLVDEDEAVRHGLRMLLQLEPDLEFVGEAGDRREVLDLARELRPDSIVMDIEHHERDFIAIRELCEMDPSIAVIVHSLYTDALTRSRAQEAGAKACMEKGTPVDTLLSEIRRWSSRLP